MRAGAVAEYVPGSMRRSGGGSGTWPVRGFVTAALAGCLPALCGCALLPRELNLAPLWFHRLDAEGEVLELDLLWPIVHYEQTPEGGDDFRIRPLYRRVTEPALQAVEHQFLWPLGRVRSDPHESTQRLFPLWSYRRHVDSEGFTDVDWYAFFPFLWGGWNERGDENYFAFLPFYADIPQFLVYDRFRVWLFPLYVGLDKEGHHHDLFLWPLIGVSSCAENGHRWFRFGPFYGYDIEPGTYDRRFLLWPFFSWSTENEYSSDPVSSFWFWPFYGTSNSHSVYGIALLWPLFSLSILEGTYYRINVLWPFFKYRWDRLEYDLTQWWLWPLVGHAVNDLQDTWSFLWPLIWWRRYTDPDVHVEQEWVLPLFWHVRQEWKDGSSEDYVKLWPLVHRTVRRDERGRKVAGELSVFSPIPWRDGNAIGYEEIYGFLWQLAIGRQRAPEDHSLDVVGRLFTERSVKDSTTGSVPFLFNYEQDRDGTVLRLFQFLPIRLGGGTGGRTP